MESKEKFDAKWCSPTKVRWLLYLYVVQSVFLLTIYFHSVLSRQQSCFGSFVLRPLKSLFSIPVMQSTLLQGSNQFKVHLADSDLEIFP